MNWNAPALEPLPSSSSYTQKNYYTLSRFLLSSILSWMIYFWLVFEWKLIEIVETNGRGRKRANIKKVHIIKMNGWHIEILLLCVHDDDKNGDFVFFIKIFSSFHFLNCHEKKLWTCQRAWLYDIKSLKIAIPASTLYLKWKIAREHLIFSFQCSVFCDSSHWNGSLNFYT